LLVEVRNSKISEQLPQVVDKPQQSYGTIAYSPSSLFTLTKYKKLSADAYYKNKSFNYIQGSAN